MTNEKKKQKGLNPDHWMCRIQKTVFGIDAQTTYMGYCPFFWMTWLALILYAPSLFWNCIIVPLHKLLCKNVNPLIKLFDAKMESNRQKRIDRGTCPSKDLYRLRTCDDLVSWNYNTSSIKDLTEYLYDGCWVTRHQYWTDCRAWASWFYNNQNWVSVYDLAQPKIIARKEKFESVKQNTCSLLSKVTFIGPLLVKIIVPALILTVVCLLSIGLWKLTLYALAIDLSSYLLAASVILFLIALVLLVIVAGDFIKTFIFANLGKGLKSMLRIVILPFEFLYETVKIAYKQECPMIIWGDETTPITKIKNEVL